MTAVSLEQLAQHIGATIASSDERALASASDIMITRVAPLDRALAGEVGFLNDKKYKSSLAETQASAVILTEKLATDYQGIALVVKDAYVGFALAAQLLNPTPKPHYAIHPSAFVDETAQLGQNVSIGPNAVIEAGVVLGDNVSIGAGAVIRVNAQIGHDSYIHPNVTVYHSCQLGHHVVVHSNTSVGCDGYGYAPHGGKWITIPQTGIVRIGNYTEIGASTTIDRGALDDTVIGEHVIIDNQVHIAHNVVVGDGACLCGGTMMAGSVNIGKNVIIAGTVAINGHITICDNVQITGNTMVTSDITEPGVYSSGMPHSPYSEWRRNSVRIKQLDSIFKRVKSLEGQVQRIQSTSDDE
ncbi:UDP-3-O-(3-hydroxymyristoyl)glucosamine N-acyltransferase [Glaciecola sp. HTCC2999]|uniref:UDP-3-O-(3-hydroxymyristoyl)glucosamine N-acyltransferase n=1 Tax=Glaciecola sp. HTCC2999 TaxID=455436 RepID=UPI0000E0E14A|nr:UDP-3-O-(3-hydroxymyristoyl)glucosamine N-acyltransferase [Glaciecola sp. HTCC2999]